MFKEQEGPAAQRPKPDEFAAWLRGIIRKSPRQRTHTKDQILTVAARDFMIARYSAEIIRMRVIATLSDREASRVWSSQGRSRA